ncbi:MAG: O-antigen ligase family protein [Gemmatimonadaceae bacterium]|nr:O-antigen ligase family protein [Gemmatimonadaceae bacterium]
MNATAAAIPHQGQQGVTLPNAFVYAVTAYTLVSMGRIHEIVRALGPLRLGLLSGVLVCALAFTAIRRDVLRAIFASPVTKGLMIVVAFTVLTIPTGVWPKASFNYLTKTYYNAVLLFIVTAAIFADRRAARFLITSLVVGVMVAGAIALLRSTPGRFEIGLTYDANETAALFTLTIPWAIYLVLTEKGWPRYVALLALPICALGILKTGSRGGLLSVGALVPFLLVLAPPKRRAPFILFVVAGAIVTALSMGDQAVYRLRKAFDTTEYNYTTRDGRIEIWKRGLGYVKGSPILGVGMDGFQYKELESKQNIGFGVRQAAAHNMYLQVAAELGLIGFSGFMTMLIGGQIVGIRARKRAKELIARGGGREADRDLLRANMAQAALFSIMCTGFFLSLGYSSMVYFACAAPIGVLLSTMTSGGPPNTPVQAAPQQQRVRGMRGWRSARPWPAGAGVHGMSTPPR